MCHEFLDLIWLEIVKQWLKVEQNAINANAAWSDQTRMSQKEIKSRIYL